VKPTEPAPMKATLRGIANLSFAGFVRAD